MHDLIKENIGKTILYAEMVDNGVVIHFYDYSSLHIMDVARHCCETRYVTTDDDIVSLNDSTLVDVKLLSGSSEIDEYDCSLDSMFLHIETSKGTVTFVNHNEHNGYYGGFDMEVVYKKVGTLEWD